MYANNPEMAKEWEEHTPGNKTLPERVKPKNPPKNKKGYKRHNIPW